MKTLGISLVASLMLCVGCAEESKCADSGCEDTGGEDPDPGPAGRSFGVAWTDCTLNVQVTNADEDHTMGIAGANWTGEACGFSTMRPKECKRVIDGANRFESINDGRMGDSQCGAGLDALDEDTTWYTGADADQLTYAFWDEEGVLVDCLGPDCGFFSP